MWRTLLNGYQYVLLVYFSSLNVLYALFSCIGLRAIVVVFAREFSQGSLRDLLERDVYKPVSILVPAHNEEVSIVGSVQSLLALQFPEFEIVVVSDGSEDETMTRLIEAFALAEQPWATRQDLPSAHVRRTFRSLTHPNLIVVDKDQGGKADSLNAGLNMARYPLFAAVDADSMLDGEAILRASRLFVEDETLIGVGGTIRPLNAAVVEDGRVIEAKIPKHWLERFQILEYARAFFTGRAGWSHFKSLLIISGAFGLFRGWKGFPFWTADGPEQDGVGLFTRFECFLRESFAVRIDRTTANGLFVEFENKGELLFNRIEHAQGLSHNFRANAVACQNGDLVGIAHLCCMQAADRGAGKPGRITLCSPAFRAAFAFRRPEPP